MFILYPDIVWTGGGGGGNLSFYTQLLYLLFIETYLYRVDIISSQATFHMCPVAILSYENKHSII